MKGRETIETELTKEENQSMGITQHMVHPQPGTLVPIDVSASGAKRSHETDSSDSDKDLSQRDDALQLAMINPNHKGWTKVEKQKGKEGKIKEYLNLGSSRSIFYLCSL